MRTGKVGAGLTLALGLILLGTLLLGCQGGPSAESYAQQGKDLLKAGQYDQAIAKFTAALKLKPDFSPVYNNRGIAYCHKGEWDLAIADFSRAIQIDPKYGKAYNNRGVARRQKGELAAAREDFLKAQSLGIQVNPVLLEPPPATEKKGGGGKP